MARRACRQVKENPLPPKQEETVTKRLFVERSRISKHLMCSICMDVFNDPVMPTSCQHTYCRKCITEVARANRTVMTPCPQCRKTFRLTQVKTNLLAASLINEAEIYCSNRGCGCPWKGELQRTMAHLNICQYGKDQVPGWLIDHQRNMEKEEEAFELLDDEVRDMQIEEQTKPLAVRLYKPTAATEEADQLAAEGDDAGRVGLEQADLNAQLTKIVTNDQEESKNVPNLSNNIYAELQKVQRDLFENELSQDAAEYEDIMDFNVGEDDDGLAAAILSSPIAATPQQDIITPKTTRQVVAKNGPKKRTKTADINDLVAMGFPRKRAKIAYESTENKVEAVQLLTLQQEEEEDQEVVPPRSKRQQVAQGESADEHDHGEDDDYDAEYDGEEDENFAIQTTGGSMPRRHPQF